MAEYLNIEKSSRALKKIPKENRNVSPVYIFNASALSIKNRELVPLRTRFVDDILSEAKNEKCISTMRSERMAKDTVREFAHEYKYTKIANIEYYVSNQVLKKDFKRTEAWHISTSKLNIDKVTGFTIKIMNRGFKDNVTTNKLFKFFREELLHSYNDVLYNHAIGSRGNIEFTFFIQPVSFLRKNDAEQMYAEYIYKLINNEFVKILKKAKANNKLFRKYFIDNMTPWYGTSSSVIGQKGVYLYEFTDNQRYPFEFYKKLLSEDTLPKGKSYEPDKFNKKINKKAKDNIKKSRATMTSIKVAKLLSLLVETESENWPIERAKVFVIALLFNTEYQRLAKIFKETNFEEFEDSDDLFEISTFKKYSFIKNFKKSINLLKEYSKVIDLFKNEEEILTMAKNILESQLSMYLDEDYLKTSENSYNKENLIKEYYKIAKDGKLVFKDKNKYAIFYRMGGDYVEGYALEFSSYRDIGYSMSDTKNEILRPLTQTRLQTVLGVENYKLLDDFYFHVGELSLLGKQKMLQDRVQEMAELLKLDVEKNGLNRERANDVYYSIIRQLFAMPDLITEEAIEDFILDTDIYIRYFNSWADVHRFIKYPMRTVNSNNEYKITNEGILKLFDPEVVKNNKAVAPNLNGVLQVNRELKKEAKREQKYKQTLKIVFDVIKGNSYSNVSKKRKISLGTISNYVSDIAFKLYKKRNLRDLTNIERKDLYFKIKALLRKINLSFIEKARATRKNPFAYNMSIEEEQINIFLIEVKNLLFNGNELCKRIN